MSQPNVPEPDGLEEEDAEPTERDDAEQMGTELARGEEAETD
jgi:hypothetical protein